MWHNNEEIKCQHYPPKKKKPKSIRDTDIGIINHGFQHINHIHFKYVKGKMDNFSKELKTIKQLKIQG